MSSILEALIQYKMISWLIALGLSVVIFIGYIIVMLIKAYTSKD